MNTIERILTAGAYDLKKNAHDVYGRALEKRDAAVEALVKSLKELIEVAGTANRSSFDQIKDALDGCQGIAEDAIAALEGCSK